jgi:ferredoxin-NADP reductase/Na+-translocating ferredoxin:NAD+ oxidoreductase RnfD subunit
VIRALDRLLDHVTMYRLVLYYLTGLLAGALILGLFKAVPHSPFALAFSTLVILAACWVTNRLFAAVFEVPANVESIYITALILALIVDPIVPTDWRGIGTLAFISFWAMASKFIFAIGRRHIFNPAAFAVAISALLLNQPATWWVGGNVALLPIVLLGGFLVIRKIQRFGLATAYIGAYLLTVSATTIPAQWATAYRETLLSSPIFFFAFVMLTEPLTAPMTRLWRLTFGAVVGFFSAPSVHIGSLYFTPEMALLIGNLFAYVAAPQRRLLLTLERIEQIGADAYDFVFRPDRGLAFQAGQYTEWTLALSKADNRGNRRYFTLASSPTETHVHLGVKFYPRSSAFKRTLSRMKPGDSVFISPAAGDFTLPADPNAKLAFLAGGIGVTPFRSMLQYLLDRGEARPIVMLYGNERSEDIAYREVLDTAATELGINTIYAVARDPRKGQYPGLIDERLIRHAIPDYRERTFLVSGHQAMVKSIRHTLVRMGVHRTRIKVDFFPGFA